MSGAEGRSLKLLGRMVRAEGTTKAEVGVFAIDPSHPLYHVNGTNTGIVFFTDTLGQVAVTGGKSDPRGTAAALLKDIICLMPWSGWQPCALMSRTRGSRCSDIMVITAM